VLTFCLALILSVITSTFCFAPFKPLSVTDVDALPLPGDAGRQAFTKFLASEPTRAFAVSPFGHWGYASKGDSQPKAVMGHCNKASRNVCRVYALNDDVVLPVRPCPRNISCGNF
jgi:hypothetical protein